MSEDKNKEKQNHPEHKKFYDAPESGTVVSKDNPSSPEDMAKDGQMDSIGEAPESGTMREK